MQRNFNKPEIRKIEKVIQETPTVRTLVFSDDILSKALPGQFAMVWIPGINELPMSIMISLEKNKAAFTVRKLGKASSALYNLEVGDFLGIRGPYGNSFEIKNGKILLVGGGTGLVPLLRLMANLKESDQVTLAMGAKTQKEVFFQELSTLIRARGNFKILIATEDGSLGQKGLVTDIVEKELDNTKYDAIYTCGPELMMSKIVQAATKKGVFVQASLERMMKCGVGICGSCCIDNQLVCKDGTIFEGRSLMEFEEFGKKFRNKAGILENY